MGERRRYFWKVSQLNKQDLLQLQPFVLMLYEIDDVWFSEVVSQKKKLLQRDFLLHQNTV